MPLVGKAIETCVSPRLYRRVPCLAGAANAKKGGREGAVNWALHTRPLAIQWHCIQLTEIGPLAVLMPNHRPGRRCVLTTPRQQDVCSADAQFGARPLEY